MAMCSGFIIQLQKKPRKRGAGRLKHTSPLCDRLHSGCLRALRALRDFVTDALAFLQAAESLGLDRREMHEDIGAAVLRCDEAEAFCVVEPFHCAVLHDSPYPRSDAFACAFTIPRRGARRRVCKADWR